MGKKPQKFRNVNYVWVLGGGYLIYLAVKVFYMIAVGTAGAPLFSGIGATLFLLLGLWLIWREWRSYTWYKKHQTEIDAMLAEELEAEQKAGAEEEQDDGNH